MNEIISIENIANSVSYLIPVKYVSGKIVEYDLRAANINTLLHAGMINKDYYDYLFKLPKNCREIEIGNLIRKDIVYYNTISEEIKKVKLRFLQDNSINPLSIVRVANDAIYLNTFVEPKITIFDNILEFRKKNEFNVMLSIGNNLIIFLKFDGDNYIIDVKGINDNNLIFHESMLSFLSNLIYMKEKVSDNDTIRYFQDFYKKYVSKELDISYYRELNSDSMYRHISGQFLLSTINDISQIDIGYNLYLLRDIWATLLNTINIKK